MLLSADKIKWGDPLLETKIIEYLRKNNHTNAGNSVGPHTILNGLKNEENQIILGISRLKDFLYSLERGGKLGQTDNRKYYLIKK